MPKIIKKTKKEELFFEGLNISNLLDKKFLSKLRESGYDVDVINLVFIMNDKGKAGYPLVLSHENNEELKKGIMHIDSPYDKIPDSFVKLLEEIESGQ